MRAYLVPEKRKILTPQLVWIAKQWVLWRMLDATEVFLHFGWARSELRTRKKVLTKAFVLLWNKAERFLEVSRPEVAWYLHIPALVEKKYKARSYYSELKTTI